MHSPSAQMYLEALAALKRKDYRRAAECFERAAPNFSGNREFNLFRETNRLLLAVKKELGRPNVVSENGDNIQIEEMFSYGQDSELR